MSQVLAALQAQAALAAETSEDMNEAVKGGGGARLLPEGWAMARYVEYVEFGLQPQVFNGAPKDPAMEVQHGFALYGDGFANEDGTPYVLRTFRMALSRNEKAKAYLLFKGMNYKGQAKCFAQLLSEGFLVYVGRHKPKDTTKKESSCIDLKKGILAPFDPVSKMPYPIPAARDEDFRLFLWDYPTIEAWEALKIDGTGEDGKSKDFIRNDIMAALDFSGSALEKLLISTGKYTPPAQPAVPSAAPALPPSGGVSAPAPVSAPAVPVMPAAAMPSAAPVVPNVAPAPVAPAPVAAVPSVPSINPPAVPAMPALPTLPQAA